MIPSQTADDRLRRAFAPTQGGIVGLTDQLLEACVGSDVEFKRVGNRCVCNWTVNGETTGGSGASAARRLPDDPGSYRRPL